MLKNIDIDLLDLPPGTVRGSIHPSPEEMDALRHHGVLQPLAVQPIPDTRPQRYQIVMGEGIWRAAQAIGLQQVPAYIRTDLDQASPAELGSPTNPMARARAMRRLLDAEPKLTRTELGHRAGMTLSKVSHHLRLLELPAAVQRLVEQGQLQYGHARALLALEDPEQQKALAHVAAQRHLSVRVIERAVRIMQTQVLGVREAVAQAIRAPASSNATVVQARGVKSCEIVQLEQQLTERLGSPVQIEHQADGQGTLMIRYFNLEILEGILEHIMGRSSNR